MAALETADEALNKVCAVFYTLTGVDSNDKREALSRDFAPLLAAHGSKVGMDKRLYDRVAMVSQGAAFLPERTGLIVADRYDAAIVREARTDPLSAPTRKRCTLAFARRAARRVIAAHDPEAVQGF